LNLNVLSIRGLHPQTLALARSKAGFSAVEIS
jgi:hypothetical protein